MRTDSDIRILGRCGNLKMVNHKGAKTQRFRDAEMQMDNLDKLNMSPRDTKL